MSDLNRQKLKIPYKPVVLIILDGVGVNTKAVESPLEVAKRPTFQEIESFWPFTTLQASGMAVGLPWGEEGNSEVGHLTIGGGRVFYNYLPRIITAMRDDSFWGNKALLQAMERAKQPAKKLHLMGLFSSGSVHAYADHLYGLLELAKRNQVPEVCLHLFTDGKDSPTREAGRFFAELEKRLQDDYPMARIYSVIGRHYAMDRDGHWDRTEKAYNMLVEGLGAKFKKASSYIDEQYKKDFTDENIEPAVSIDLDGRIQDGDAVIFYNFRSDSPRQLTRAFVEKNFTKFKRRFLQELLFVTMTEYDENLPVLVAFPPVKVKNSLAETIAQAGLLQIHIAETVKYAHVTYFFNGEHKQPFKNERWLLFPSPAVAHFDQTPEMSADDIAKAVVNNLLRYDFILANFANGDMVGHTGNFNATVRALEVLDACIKKILPKVLEVGGALIITADHGNAEEKYYKLTGEKRTQHTTNPVPFYLITNELRQKEARSKQEILKMYNQIRGTLTDIAPTVLELMGLQKPKEMTGTSLLNKLI